jgi:hypothetical protein
MAKIYLAPCSKADHEHSLKELVALAQPSIHTFVESPEAADIILVIDVVHAYHQHRSLLQQYLDKCYAIENEDIPYLVLPGLFASASASFFHRHRIRGCAYFSQRQYRSPLLTGASCSKEQQDQGRQYLLSFMGGSTCLLRKRLFNLKFERSDILIQPTLDYGHWDLNQANRLTFQQRYIESLRSSKFILCPRGSGLGSVRLFEAMEMGVSPIIVSDRWLPPEGPDWQSFAIFVKESDLKKLPKIIEQYASEYEIRGQLARQAWEEHFSDAVLFNRYISAIEQLKPQRIFLLDRLIFYTYPITLTIRTIKNSARTLVRNAILALFRRFKLKFPYQMKQT